MSCSRPKIWVVLRDVGDRYHLFRVDLVTYFFSEDEADAYCDGKPELRVEEIDPGSPE